MVKVIEERRREEYETNNVKKIFTILWIINKKLL